MDAYVQQRLTIQSAVEAGLVVDEVWKRYRSVGGTNDGVDIAAYLRGMVLLNYLQRDLVTYSVNELLWESGESTDSDPRVRRIGAGNEDTGQSSVAFEQCGQRPAPYSQDFTPDSADSARVHNPHMVSGDSRTGTSALTTAVPAFFSIGEAEKRRLASLDSTGLLPTLVEERFDKLTEEARIAFGVSSACITLIGENEQSIKSVSGTIDPSAPREHSFCSETILADRALVIPDAYKDGRFTRNPLVRGEPRIRFYAGHPLLGPGGWRIGTLCLLDNSPRSFTEEDERNLRVLAGKAQAEILQPPVVRALHHR